MSTGISRYLKYWTSQKLILAWYLKYWTSHKIIPANTNSLRMTSIYSMEYMSTQKHHMPPKPEINLA